MRLLGKQASEERMREARGRLNPRMPDQPSQITIVQTHRSPRDIPLLAKRLFRRFEQVSVHAHLCHDGASSL